jgi:hypothetical protein
MYIAIIGTVGGLIWFGFAQRRPDRPVVVRPDPAQPDAGTAPTPVEAPPDEATADAGGVASARSEE